MVTVLRPLTKLFVLLKFGQEEHMRALRDEGMVYMNTVKFFRDCETDAGRGDRNEGTPWLKNYPPGEFRVSWAKDKTFHFQALQVKAQPKDTPGHIYSLFSFASHHSIGFEEFRVDPANKRFGSHMVMIHQPVAFLRRWEEAMRWKQIEHTRGFVNYYDPSTYTGGLNVFWKSFAYAHQQEYRLHAMTASKKPLVLRLGPLNDIAEVYPSNAVDELVMRPK